jgi:hypothetical protein
MSAGSMSLAVMSTGAGDLAIEWGRRAVGCALGEAGRRHRFRTAHVAAADIVVEDADAELADFDSTYASGELAAGGSSADTFVLLPRSRS